MERSRAAAPQDGTILVTGFGPFYGHSVNASWVAVQELARLTVHNPDGTHCKLDIREIPVEYEVVATEVPKLWRDVNPLDGTCTRDPNMNLIIQYGLLGLVLGLGLGLGFILYCRIWRPLALPYMCPQPLIRASVSTWVCPPMIAS